jgi:hypothetical protein
VGFRLGRTKFKRSLKTIDIDEAEGRLARLKENIRLIESGRLVLPEHPDPAAFLLSDGKLNDTARVAERLALSQLIERYRAALPEGALEPESLRIAELHIRHFVRVLGIRKELADMDLDDLQHYVLKRSREPGRHGLRVSVGTIRKELATLTTLWNCTVQHFPSEHTDNHAHTKFRQSNNSLAHRLLPYLEDIELRVLSLCRRR